MKWLDRQIDAFIQRIRDDPDTKKIPIGPGGADDPTYWRYFVIPRNPVFNIYLHRFLKDDEEHHHDHRMLNITFILQGSYFEERFAWRPHEGLPLPATKLIPVEQRQLFARLPSTPHRVVLKRDADNRPIPIWSLFIGFPQLRKWGFWCPGDGAARWVPFERYVSSIDPLNPGYGKPGLGCDG